MTLDLALRVYSRRRPAEGATEPHAFSEPPTGSFLQGL